MFWKRSFRKHCSDESLVGHLDGELSPWRAAIVRSHLKTCWECRGRLVELEAQAQAVVKALAYPPFPEADPLTAATHKILPLEHRIARDFRHAPRLSLLA